MNSFWNGIIYPILQQMNAQTIVEIGCADGLNTMHLLSYAQARNGKVIAIDPAPQFDLEQVQTTYPHALDMRLDYSLQVLPQLHRVDAVLIDGDHNWYTVYHELKQLERMEYFPVVFLHDLEWPYGRRDMYYFPDSIPIEYRQPSAVKGMMPGIKELVDNGHNYTVHNALLEDGPRNGVLTAVEDFLQETPLQLNLYRVHSQHGLGIIIPKDSVHLKHDEVIDILNKSGL